MNPRQKVALALGLLALVSLVLCPPWLLTMTTPDGRVIKEPLGHHGLLAPPTGRGHFGVQRSYDIDYRRLLVLVGAIVAITVSGVALLSKSSSRP